MLVFFPGASGKENPNFYEICPTMAHGNNGYFWFANLKFRDSSQEKTRQKNCNSLQWKSRLEPIEFEKRQGLGFQKTCPRDGKPHCSIVDALNETCTGDLVALHFAKNGDCQSSMSDGQVALSINILQKIYTFPCPCQKQRKNHYTSRPDSMLRKRKTGDIWYML